MGLQVVGSGLGRTGTKSLHSALSILGYGPCHHMVEVFAHPESMRLWVEAFKGRPDWDMIFKDYRAMVDYPGAQYWRELADYYPGAKILHTVRDPDQWFDSTQATIFAPDSPALGPGPGQEFFQTILGQFGEHLHDRAFMTDFFRRHTEKVIATIPAKRLLVYRVSEGWGPLCEFLDVQVPAVPFPAENSRAEFIGRTQIGRMMTSPAH
ncbi:MAG TPA: sulfotransferase [Rhizomicrobium sp.]|nr:sulfotransferase [Rhizomicrobium sp.]